jgi:hypothetical protein
MRKAWDHKRSHNKSVGLGVRLKIGKRGLQELQESLLTMMNARRGSWRSHKKRILGIPCKDLDGHIFTIGSGNNGKDGDMLRTSMERIATYIGTKYGNEAAQ